VQITGTTQTMVDSLEAELYDEVLGIFTRLT
jgi:hypothetical protein